MPTSLDVQQRETITVPAFINVMYAFELAVCGLAATAALFYYITLRKIPGRHHTDRLQLLATE